MGEVETQVRRLIDESDIRALMYRYARGITTKDRQLVLDCFTDDLELDYGFRQIHGKDEFREFQSGSSAAPTSAVLQLERSLASTQAISNIEIEITGDEAAVRITGLSIHVGPRGDETVAQVRSLHYTDKCVRLAEGWRIARRQYTPQWTFVVPGILPAQSGK
ncbi:nuclear transport factor 2 family protein [Amycolatopsis sp. GM8]|uniref:nuclear transport factor 2 family protein n=1 Tax=Amycolatopsis sp. GM8 TaxID=2896530 RepID=UPI001F299A65|nr:nuclear transport factor 2 family protein [Amycolatopsis sp. GM8]